MELSEDERVVTVVAETQLRFTMLFQFTAERQVRSREKKGAVIERELRPGTRSFHLSRIFHVADAELP